MNLRQLRADYIKHTQFELLPIYIGLSGLTAWLGAVTIILMGEINAAAGPVRELAIAAAGLSLFFGAWPFLGPVVGMVAEVWLGNHGNIDQ